MCKDLHEIKHYWSSKSAKEQMQVCPSVHGRSGPSSDEITKEKILEE